MTGIDLRTGVHKLDSILKGGIPLNSDVLLLGPPEVGKEVLTYHFIYEGLKKGEAAFYVYSGKKNKVLEEDFASYKMNIETYIKSGNLLWIDAEGESVGSNVVNATLSELYTISHAIKEFLEKNKDKTIRGVVEIVSPALMLHSEMDVYKFLSELMKTLANYKSTTLFVVEQGMHDVKTVVAIEQLCDAIIEMETGEINYLLRVKKMRGKPITLQNYSYWISERGIEMLE